jgi:integrase
MLFADVKDGFLFVEQEKTKQKLRIPVTVRNDALGMSIEDVVKRCRDAVVSKNMIHHARSLRVRKPGDAVDKDDITRLFQKAREASKITWEKGRTAPSFHEIRSLSARLYAEQYGKDFAQAILGHKSASMTAMYRDTRGAEWTEVKFAG